MVEISKTHAEKTDRYVQCLSLIHILLKEEAVPDDASAIIINAPTSDFSADDAKKVTDYLEKGGKALITTNFQYKDLTNFESILKAYGIERVDGIVMENDSCLLYTSSAHICSIM